MSKLMFALAGVLTLAVPCYAADVAPMALNSFSSVPKGLRTAVAADETGKAIGIVEAVKVDGSGKPDTLEIVFPGGREVQFPAAQASYDPVSNMVVTDGVGIATADTKPGPSSIHP